MYPSVTAGRSRYGCGGGPGSAPTVAAGCPARSVDGQDRAHDERVDRRGEPRRSLAARSVRVAGAADALAGTVEPAPATASTRGAPGDRGDPSAHPMSATCSASESTQAANERGLSRRAAAGRRRRQLDVAAVPAAVGDEALVGRQQHLQRRRVDDVGRRRHWRSRHGVDQLEHDERPLEAPPDVAEAPRRPAHRRSRSTCRPARPGREHGVDGVDRRPASRALRRGRAGAEDPPRGGREELADVAASPTSSARRSPTAARGRRQLGVEAARPPAVTSIVGRAPLGHAAQRAPPSPRRPAAAVEPDERRVLAAPGGDARAVRAIASARSAARPIQNSASAARVGTEAARSTWGSAGRRSRRASRSPPSTHTSLASGPSGGAGRRRRPAPARCRRPSRAPRRAGDRVEPDDDRRRGDVAVAEGRHRRPARRRRRAGRARAAAGEGLDRGRPVAAQVDVLDQPAPWALASTTPPSAAAEGSPGTRRRRAR